VAYLLALCARAVRAEKTLNLEQVRMSRRDAVCAANRAPAACGGRLVSFEEGMARTISRFGREALLGGEGR